LLESELEQERNNVRTQTGKVNMLRKEFAALALSLDNQGRENEALITKLATLSVTINELEERFKAKEEEFSCLQELKDTLMQDNESLRKIQEDLMEERNALLLREPTTPVAGQSNKAVIEDFASQMMRELAAKFNISDENTLKDLTSNYLTRFEASINQGETSTNGSEAKRSRAELAQELMAEKEKNAKLESDYQKLKEQYEKAGVNKTPFKNPKFASGEGGVLNDEKEKLKIPGSNNLVQNLDQLSNMYQQIAQKSQGRVEQVSVIMTCFITSITF